MDFVNKSKLQKEKKNKFLIYSKSAFVHEYEIKVKFIGNLSLLPIDVREVADKVMEETKHYDK
jgi:undecaprenyl pyrophosphate synthase